MSYSMKKGKLKLNILRYPTLRTLQTLLNTVVPTVLWPCCNFVRYRLNRLSRLTYSVDTHWETLHDLFYPALYTADRSDLDVPAYVEDFCWSGLCSYHNTRRSSRHMPRGTLLEDCLAYLFQSYKFCSSFTGSPSNSMNNVISFWGGMCKRIVNYFEKHPSVTIVMLTVALDWDDLGEDYVSQIGGKKGQRGPLFFIISDLCLIPCVHIYIIFVHSIIFKTYFPFSFSKIKAQFGE